MAQDILITPGSGEPQILFRGSGVSDTSINLNVISSHQSATGSGTALSFEGTQGQLFGVTDNLSSGTIFSVSDITGLPLIEADASGDVKIGEYGRYVGIGSGVPGYGLDVFSSGHFHKGFILASYTPATTTNALYNDGGALKFNGSAVGGVSEGDAYSGGTSSGIVYVNISGNLASDGPTVTSNGVTIHDATNQRIIFAAAPTYSSMALLNSAGTYKALVRAISEDLYIGNYSLTGSTKFYINNSATLALAIDKDANSTFSGDVIAQGVSVTAPAATDVPLVISAAASQSANLLEVNSWPGLSGDLLKLESDGKLRVAGNISSVQGNGSAGSSLTTSYPSATVPNILPSHGDANTGIGSAAGDTLSLIAGAVEGIRITGYGKILMDQGNLSAATGDEVMHSISYTTNKATSGNDTGLLIAMTDTASPGTSLLLDAQVGGVSKFSVDSAGTLLCNQIGNVDELGQVIFKNGGAWNSITERQLRDTSFGFQDGYPAIRTSSDYLLTGKSNSIIISASNGLKFRTAVNTATGTSMKWSAAGEVSLYIDDGSALGQFNAGILTATAPAATDVPLVIEAAAAQSANLFEVNSSSVSGGNLFNVSSSGDVTASGTLKASAVTIANDVGNEVTTSIHPAAGTVTLNMGANEPYIISGSAGGNWFNSSHSNGLTIGYGANVGNYYKGLWLDFANSSTAGHVGLVGAEAGVISVVTDRSVVGSALSLGTLRAATVDNPSAALTVGNATYGVTLPGSGVFEDNVSISGTLLVSSGSKTAPAFSLLNASTVGFFGVGSQLHFSDGGGGGANSLGFVGGIRFSSLNSVTWSSTASSQESPDTRLSRSSANNVKVWNGTALGQFDAGILTATAPAATDVPLVIEAAAAQSANLVNITTDGGTAGDLFKVSANGLTTIGGILYANNGSSDTIYNGGFFSTPGNKWYLRQSTGNALSWDSYNGGGTTLEVFTLSEEGTATFSGSGIFEDNVSISGDLSVTGRVVASGGILLGDGERITPPITSDLLIGEQRSGAGMIKTRFDNSSIQFGTSDGTATGMNVMMMLRSNDTFRPGSDLELHLGTSAIRWNNAYFGGTVDTSSVETGSGILTAQTATSIPLTVNAAASQSANLLEINSWPGLSGNLFKINSAGGFTVSSNSYVRPYFAVQTAAGANRFVVSTTSNVAQLEGNMVFKVSTGSALSPSLCTTSDDNTGLYWSGADEISIATSGVNALTIDAGQSARFAGSGIFEDNVAVSGVATFAKATKPALKANADATTVTFDVNEANVHTVTLGANRIFAISNETAGQKFMIRILQDGTGSRTVTWFSTIKWAGGSAPTLTTTASKADVVGFLVTGTDTYDGFVIGQNI